MTSSNSRRRTPFASSTSERVVCVALACLLGAGCVKHVSVSPLSTTEPVRGVVYALPKTLLKVTVTYTVQEKRKLVHGAVKGDPAQSVVISKPIVIEPVNLADERARLVLQGSDLSDDWLLETNLGFAVDERGLLASVEADTKDQTLAAAKALVTAGIDAVELVTVAKSGDDEPLKSLRKRLEELYALVPTVKEGKDGKPTRLEQLDQLRKEIELLLGLIEAWSKSNTSTVSSADFVIVTLVDPEACERKDALLSCRVQPPSLGSGLPRETLPVVKLLLEVPQTASALATTTLAARQGVAYRVPLTTRLRVEAAFGGATWQLADTEVRLAQFGPIAFVDASTRPLGNRKTSATFDAAGLRTYKVDSSSVADKALDSAAGALESSRKALTAVRYDLQLESLEKQKSLADAKKALEPKTEDEEALAALKRKTALLQAEAELEKAKKALEDARAQ